MPRTTAEAVARVRTVDVPDGFTLEAWLAPSIEVSNALVTEHCVNGVQTVARLELIERWLAAHFISLHNDFRLTLSETVGPITETFLFKVGYNLNQTTYGQQAMLLDSTGNLAAWNKQVEKGTTGGTSIIWGGVART